MYPLLELSDEQLMALAERAGYRCDAARADLQRAAIAAAKHRLDAGQQIPEHVLQAIVQTLPDEVVLARADQLRDALRRCISCGATLKEGETCEQWICAVLNSDVNRL